MIGPSVQIRLATPNDAGAVARVHVRAWQVAYRGLLPDAYLDGLRPEERAARYTFNGQDPNRPTTIVAAREGVILGFATVGRARDKTRAGGELMALNVDPPCWNRGVGRALIAAAREHLVQSSHREAELWVLDGNERAYRFYAADGWSPDGGKRTETVWGVRLTDLRYTRRLP
jgi:GNAT superfamily N-acetyltransferase